MIHALPETPEVAPPVPTSQGPLVVSFFNVSPKNPGDLVTWHSAMAAKLSANGARLRLLTLSSSCSHLLRAAARNGLEVDSLPPDCSNRRRLISTLLRLILRERVRIFHANFFRPVDLAVLILLVKILLRGTVFIYHKQSSGRLILNPLNPKKYINPLSLVGLLAHKIVCLSRAIEHNCLSRGVSPRKLLTIYNGVSLERFEHATATGKIRRELGIPDHWAIMTTIKEARPETGLEDLLLSMPDVLGRFPDSVLLVVGGGAHTDGLKLLTQQLGIQRNVIFTGGRHDIPEIIAESLFTIDPSPVEAFGNVIVESMAGRRAVIAVNAWGPPEILKHGETGLLVEPGNPTRFASAILDLLSSPAAARKMGESAFLDVRDRFSIDRSANEMVKLWASYLRE